MTIQIFPAESEIAESILNDTKASCQIRFLPHEPSRNEAKAALEQIKAGCGIGPMQTDDLFFFRSIMATSSVNLNDDGFLASEMYQARNTPIAKFVNIEHEADACAVEFGAGGIVGTIVDSFMMDEDMTLIDPEQEEVPAFFHLGTTNVIWRHLNNELLRAKATLLIKKIEEGSMAVSMESMFNGFDYGLCDDDQKYSDGTFSTQNMDIIARNEVTAFMTKHLRAYGGDGKYNGKKLVRVLKGITFTGLGVVSEPANPSSIMLKNEDILKKSEKNEEVLSISASSGVYNNDDTSKTESKMTDILESQLKEAQETIAELRKELELAKELSVKADFEKAQKELQDAQAAIESKEEVIQTLESAKACMCNQYEEKAAELETVKKEKEELAAKLAELEKSQVEAMRVAAFEEKGYSETEASAIVAKLVSLDDETFNVVLAGYASKTAPADDSNIKIESVEKPAEAATASFNPQVEEEAPEVAFARLAKGIAEQMTKNRTLKDTGEGK